MLLLLSLIIVNRICFELNGMSKQFLFLNTSSEVITDPCRTRYSMNEIIVYFLPFDQFLFLDHIAYIK